MKNILNILLQFILEVLDNLAIVVASLAIYLMMSFGFDTSEVVIEHNPGALIAVLIFVSVWTLTVVLVGLLVRALRDLKSSYDRQEVQQ